jgi:hypothetical protein
MAQFYGVHDLIEAQSYWAHPVLGSRLKECVLAVLEVPSKSAHEIFGSPDDFKFCSCLPLFEQVSPDRCFGAALERFYGGRRDERTMALLEVRPARRELLTGALRTALIAVLQRSRRRCVPARAPSDSRALPRTSYRVAAMRL